MAQQAGLSAKINDQLAKLQFATTAALLHSKGGGGGAAHIGGPPATEQYLEIERERYRLGSREASRGGSDRGEQFHAIEALRRGEGVDALGGAPMARGGGEFSHVPIALTEANPDTDDLDRLLHSFLKQGGDMRGHA